MKTTSIPTICCLALAVMSAAGLSHWWSLQQFTAAIHTSLPVIAPTKPASLTPAAPELLVQAPKNPAPATDEAEKKFYEALVSKMEKLQNQNQDLLDQMAETNRDVMKLEFRVDTHSESFRPMPVSEKRLDTSFDTGPGVLPPRAEPVFLPSGE
jgi:hypothetical protein